MKKMYIGVGIVVVAGAIVAGVLLKKPSDQPINTNQEQTTNQTDETVNPSGSYSINELFTMNRPLKCTWVESATGDKDVTNILYISGKKFYQDVTMGDIGHAYTISDGEYLYIWNDFNDTASKMKITETETGIKQEQGTTATDQKKDFVCEKWSVDASVFNPPQDKNFQDVTEEMNQAMQSVDLEKTKQQVCDLCEGAPTQELKDQCLANSQCN
jgi:hypothetical protein